MIYNLGSINVDLFYRLPHLPAPGETLASTDFSRGLGGKGANMSVAAARAGAQVVHIGAVGEDGRWARDRLQEYGVNCQNVRVVETPTGHAVIYVDGSGENQIVLFPGANVSLRITDVSAAMTDAGEGDTLLFQNETNLQNFVADFGRARSMRVVYAAAPFDADAVRNVIDRIDLLVLNEVEAQQLTEALDNGIDRLDVSDVVVTLGADGCRHYANSAGTVTDYPGIRIVPVDTTGAGDTFTGYLVAGLDQQMDIPETIDLAQRAAALMVTRQGTADVIPTREDVDAFSR